MTQLREPGQEPALRLNFHKGQQAAWDSQKLIVAIFAGTRSGKALALDTLIPTPEGFVPMGQLQVGDCVYAEDGSPTRITYVSPVFVGNRCYRVSFSDGSSIVADAGHLWVVRQRNHRKNMVRRIAASDPRWKTRKQCTPIPDQATLTTEEMVASVVVKDRTLNYSVDAPAPFAGKVQACPVPPYTLGAWLGDGHSSCANLTTMDKEILGFIQAEGVTVKETNSKSSGKAKVYLLGGGSRGGDMSTRQDRLQTKLRSLGVLPHKHIPQAYLFGPPAVRLAVLQGLMDTDGSCCGSACELTLLEGRLSDDAMVLIRGLGIKAYRVRRIPHLNGKACRPCSRITFTTDMPVFRLPRKLARLPVRARPDTKRRFITAIEPVDSVPTRCISVDAPSRQYLCGDAFIPTHNTSFGPWWLHREVLDRGPGDYLVVAPSYQLLDKAAAPELEYVFGQLLGLGKMRQSPSFHFRLSHQAERDLWGAPQERPTRILFGHADDPESLEAMTAKAVWLDEAGQKRFKYASWQAIKRRRSFHRGRILLTTTLYNLGWLKQIIHDPWKAAEGNHPLIDLIRFDSTANPAFPREEWEEAMRELPTWKFNLFFRAIFTRPAGLIYDNFDAAKHTCKRFRIPDEWKRYGGLDFGGINTVGLKYARNPASGKLYLYAAYAPKETRTAAEHAKHLQAGEAGSQPGATCPRIKWVGGSKSEGQWRKEFTAAGMHVEEPPIHEVEVGIDRVYAAHADDEIIVFDDLKGYLDEKGSYSRVLNEMDEPTEAIEDKETYHALDAERYIISWLRRNQRSGGKINLTGQRGVLDGVAVDAYKHRR